MKPKLAVCGAAGRMGKRIVSLAVESGDFQITGAVDRGDHPDLGADAGQLAGAGKIEVELSARFQAQCDVVIDFSGPEAADTTMDYCLNKNAALVMGTTGLSDAQQQKIKAAAEKIPLIYGTNMSVGMNVLFALVGQVANMLGEDYDIEIIEQHHRFKKDAPSGSALTLAENICQATGRDYPGSIRHGRHGKDALRQKGEIGMHAVRAGDITGIHSVIFAAPGETVTLNHNAATRDNFVKGALRAAAWLPGKKPGYYSMANVLGLK